MIEDIEMSKTILSKINPDLVVSWSWGGFRLAICLVCKSIGAPVIGFDYGTVVDWKELVSKKSEDLPDKICVALKVKYDFWRERGIPKNRLELTGSPSMDVVRIADKVYRRYGFCKRANLDPNKHLVMIISGGDPYAFELVKQTLQVLEAIPGISAFIVPRPNETMESCEHLVGSRATVLPSGTDLFEALYIADLVVGYISTAIVEGVVLGTPAVTAYLKKDVSPYLGKMTLRVPVTQLGNAVEKALCDGAVKSRLRAKVRLYQMENKCNGYSTERFCDVVQGMIK